jgi:hypothetical protein
MEGLSTNSFPHPYFVGFRAFHGAAGTNADTICGTDEKRNPSLAAMRARWELDTAAGVHASLLAC